MPGFCLNSGLDSPASASRSILHGNGVACGVYKQGGGFALLLANDGYDAATSNYGMLPKNMEEALSGACPILGNYGAKGKQLANPKVKLDETLTKLNVVHDIKEFSGAGHAFMNPKQGGGPIFGTLLRVTGAKPDPAAAKEAWSRIEDFFGKYLH